MGNTGMLTNEELLEILKAQIDTSSSSGIAAPQDAEEFIDLSVKQSHILQNIHVETGIRTSYNLDSLRLADPVTIAATEGTAPGEEDVVAVARARKVLQPVEIIAAFDVTFSFLRKNIERERVNETLNQIFARRFGKDIVLFTFSGDTVLPPDTRMNKALRIRDGFIKQAEIDQATHRYIIPPNPVYNTTVFPQMLALLPKDYRDQREDLGFFCSAAVYDSYAREIGERATALGDMILAGPWGRNLSYMGVNLYPVYGMPDGRIILTLRENLVVGFGQEMTVGRDIDNRARLLKVTITADVDNTYIEGDALVLGAA